MAVTSATRARPRPRMAVTAAGATDLEFGVERVFGGEHMCARTFSQTHVRKNAFAYDVCKNAVLLTCVCKNVFVATRCDCVFCMFGTTHTVDVGRACRTMCVLGRRTPQETGDAMSEARHASSSRHAPMWCDDCERTHDGTHDDARSILGHDGFIYGVAYARCTVPNGCGELHITHTVERADRITRYDVCSRPFGRKQRARMRWTDGSAPVALSYCDRCGVARDAHDDVTDHTYRAARSTRADAVRIIKARDRNAYRRAQAYERRMMWERAQRTTDNAPSALPSPIMPVRPVTLTQSARAAMARTSRSTFATDAQRARDDVARANERARQDARLEAYERRAESSRAR